MTIFEISNKVKKFHSANPEPAANYIANEEGEIIQVINIEEYVTTDCYCFICNKTDDNEILIKLI